MADSSPDGNEPNPTPQRRPLRIELVRSDIEALLDEIDSAMTEAGLTGSVDLVGGAAMALRYYDRIGTTDVDGSVYPSPEIIAIADVVGARHGLKAGWLNNAAQGFMPPGDTGEDPVIARQGTSLTVRVVGPKTLLAMKLRASRPSKDADDIAVLLRECGVTTLDGAKAILDEMYDGEEELSTRGERIVLGALGAHQIMEAGGTIIDLVAVGTAETATCGKWVLRLDRRCGLGPAHAGTCG